jgi:hypothetical protein
MFILLNVVISNYFKVYWANIDYQKPFERKIVLIFYKSVFTILSTYNFQVCGDTKL